MGDLGELFDMFSNEDNEKRTRKKHGAQDEAPENDLQSLVMGKLSKNKPLLIVTVVAALAILGGLAFIAVKYIGANGAKRIIDTIKQFTN